MSGKKSKSKGHNFELTIRALLTKWFPDCQTSRYSSREKDDNKVDLCGTDPFNYQCKALERAPNYHTTLKEMPDDSNINILVHKKNRQGVTVTMMWEDWEEILEMLRGNGAI